MPHKGVSEFTYIKTPYTRTVINGSTSVSTSGTYNDWDYRQRCATTKSPMRSDGWRYPTAYYGTRSYLRYGTLDIMRDQTRGILGAPLMAVIPSLGFAQPPSNLEDKTYQRALLKFKDRKINLAVFAGEFRETSIMTVELYRLLRRFIKDARSLLKGRGLTPGSKEYLAYLNELWLTYRYGVRPLVQDLQGALDRLSDALEDKELNWLTVRARSTRQRRKEYYLGRASYLSSLTSTVSFDRYFVCTQEAFVCRVRMDATADSTFNRSLHDLGIYDPYLAAWELTRASFIADWVVGVGDYLDGLTAMKGLAYQGGTTTMWKGWVGHMELRNPIPTPYSWSYTKPAYWGTSFRRDVLGDPQSRLVWFGLEKVLTPLHLADLGAIFRNLIR